MGVDLKEFAELLDGRAYGAETSEKTVELAKEHGFVIIYGSSDDLAQIDGAIQEEVGCYDGGEIPFFAGGLLEKECEDDNCPHEDRMIERAYKVTAVWCGKDKPSWSYETDIRHEKFNIWEDGEVFCEGIVFSKEDIK